MGTEKVHSRFGDPESTEPKSPGKSPGKRPRIKEEVEKERNFQLGKKDSRQTPKMPEAKFFITANKIFKESSPHPQTMAQKPKSSCQRKVSDSTRKKRHSCLESFWRILGPVATLSKSEASTEMCLKPPQMILMYVCACKTSSLNPCF